MHFIYTGKDSFGAAVQGKITAVSRDAAQDMLNKDGITIIEIDIDDETSSFLDKFNVFNNPTATDLIIFSKQMHALLRSGVPIIRSINIVGDS